MPDSGLILGPLINLQALIAASSTFQSITQTANATDALAFTHLIYPPTQSGGETYTIQELQAKRPWAVVDWYASRRGISGEGFRAEATALNAPTAISNMFVTFEDNTPADKLDDPEGQLIYFSRQMEAIAGEMLDLSQGTGEYLCIQTIELFMPPFRAPPEDVQSLGDYWRTTFKITTPEYPR